MSPAAPGRKGSGRHEKEVVEAVAACGGHAAAAGATLHGTLGEVKQAVLQAIDMVAGED